LTASATAHTFDDRPRSLQTGAVVDARERRYVVISADSHDSPPYHLEKYVDYMDPEHRSTYVEWLEGDGRRLAGTIRFGGPSKAYDENERYTSTSDDPYRRYWEELQIGRMGIDERWHKESFGRYRPTEPPGFLDPVARVASQESQGIVGEVINSTGFATVNSSQFGAHDRELLRAGTMAHLRWLADYSGAVPGRLATPIYVDGRDLDEAIADITWAREHGIFGGVVLPVTWPGGNAMMGGSTSTQAGPGLPPYLDRYWEPLWSVCEDLELPLVLHVGQNVAPDIATAYGDDTNAHWIMAAFEQSYFAKRPFFQMIAGGVFDRHPRLKFCISEIHVASLPGLFQEADHQTLGFDGWQRNGIELAPSEYWYRNGFVAASMMSPREAAIRHDIGIQSLMFGSDYPHPEGTWPHTTAVLRYVLAGVPEDELRAILGENAARCFGFDLQQLRPIADRVGPTVAELAEPLPDEDVPPYASTFSLHPQFV
jgi:predicted TIM-barrel fold metal-dependent hydrolase